MSFVHLHAHSAYSLSEGAIKADKLAALAAQGGMPAVALTDSANLFGALEFAQGCAAKGVQPIMGCQFFLGRAETEEPGRTIDPARNRPDPVVALALDAAGLDNLQRLSSRGVSRLETRPGCPCLKLDTLGAHAAGAVPAHGRHARHDSGGCWPRGRRDAAPGSWRAWRKCFPDRFGLRAAPPRPARGAPGGAGLLALARGSRACRSSPRTTSTFAAPKMHGAP
jgi:DNA polymerase-3 subunit alpha